MNSSWCGESGKALGFAKDIGEWFPCFLCRKRVQARLEGEHVVVSRHHWPTSKSTTRKPAPAPTWFDTCECAGAPHADHCPQAPEWRRMDYWL